MEEIEQFRDKNHTCGAIISLIFNDIKVEQSLELSNVALKNLFADCFHLLPKRRAITDRNFVRNLDADQFDRLDQVFNEYILEKYADNPAQATQLIEKAGPYFQKIFG